MPSAPPDSEAYSARPRTVTSPTVLPIAREDGFRHLRLLGINMADEASETMAGALKNWLGALGFIAPLVAHFVDTQHPSLPPWASIALMLAGLAIYASPVAWMRVTGRGQKPMAIAVIIVSALGLMFGIYLLARPSASAPPQTPTDDAEKPTLTGPPNVRRGIYETAAA